MALFGPLYFFYVRAAVHRKKVRLIDGLHLIPLVVVIVLLSDFFFQSAENKLELLRAGHVKNSAPLRTFFDWSLTISMISYGIITHQKYVRPFKKDYDLRVWMSASSFLFILFTCSWLAYYILVYTGLLKTEYDYFITYMMVLFVGTVSYFSFVQPDVFNGTPITKVIPFIKYEKTGLPESFSTELKEKLVTLMEDSKPYLNPDLRLNDLADMLDISRHHASQIINEHFNTNFFDFINKYRVEEAERMLDDDGLDLNITDIAFQSGFNNRVSFYKAFKKIVGTTPTEYKEQHLAS